MLPVTKTTTFLSIASFVGAMVLLAVTDSRPVAFESLQSKTSTGGAVFNSVSVNWGWKEDVWLMQQSHSGATAPKTEWDNIAIAVNKSSEVKTAEFFQLQPGANHISMDLPKVGLKATCFTCHSNGPRAIRANYKSKELPVSLWNRWRIALWNLRIKTYGATRGFASNTSHKPFKWDHPYANTTLKLKSCTGCHNGGDGPLDRAPLTRQNFASIQFLVDQGQMPPPGHSLSEDDKQAIKNWKL